MSIHNPENKECLRKQSPLYPCTCPKEVVEKCQHGDKTEQMKKYCGAHCPCPSPDTSVEGWAYAPYYTELRQVLSKHQNEWKNELLADLSSLLSQARQEERERIWREARSLRKYEEDPIALSDLKPIIGITEKV